MCPSGDTIHLRHVIPCLPNGDLIGTFQMDSGFLLGSSSYASLLGVPVPEDVAEREERAWKLEQVRVHRGGMGCL